MSAQQIAEFFKADWITGKLIPRCIDFMNKDKLGYLHRVAAFNTIKVSSAAHLFIRPRFPF